MTLRINSEAPDFTAETTHGVINFHEWIGNSWAILFSHPKDFTPVCTTELGYMARLKPEFDKRNCKIIGLSVDPVGNHSRWAKEIEETQGHAVTYPMIGDPQLKVAKLYDMLPAEAGDTLRRPDRRRQRHSARRLRDRSGQKDQGDTDLSDEQRAKL
jgi:thioredoxin-dependent peroxiredoxin